MDKFYQIEEDTEFLLKNVIKVLNSNKKYKNKNIRFFEVGVGNGFIISTIAKKFNYFTFIGSDINIFAIKKTKDELKKLNINSLILKGEFFLNEIDLDLVIFNPPYLPLDFKKKINELNLIDKAIYGGKNGNEVIIKFILEIFNHLNKTGEIIFLASSNGKIKEILEILKLYSYDVEILDETNFFFESLFCIKIRFGKFLKDLKSLKIQNLKFYDKGKSSLVFSGKLNQKEVIIKKFFNNKSSQLREEFFIKKFQKKNFIPKIFFSSKSFIIIEKIDGILINDFLNLGKEFEIRIILKKLLDICFFLDKNCVNKFELINPYKHIFITKDLNLKFIDFEKMIFSEKPKNISQILEFFRRRIEILKNKNINLDEKKIFEISKEYKRKFKKFDINSLFE